AAPAAPTVIPAAAGLAGPELPEEPREAVLGVAHDRELGLEERADHGWIEIEVDQCLSGIERQIQEEALCRAVGEAAADREHDVGGLQHRLTGAAVRQHGVPERVALADGASSHHSRQEGGVEAARERAKLGL